MKKYIPTYVFLFLSYLSVAQEPVNLVQLQLEAYNNRDIEAFLTPYSDTVKVFGAGKMMYQGKDIMRKQYSMMFERYTELNGKVLNRIIVGNTVIDHEEVTFKPGDGLQAAVLYRIGDGKIQEVHFMAQEGL